MKIAIYGLGGVGGYLAGRVAGSDAEVHGIARGPHLEAIRTSGLALQSRHGDSHVRLPVTDDPAEVGVCDAVIVCVKTSDTEAAVRRMTPMLGEHTCVVTFQNGVDNAERIRAIAHHDHVVPGLVYIFATIVEPGVVAHTGGPASFVVGDSRGAARRNGERLVNVLAAAGVDVRWDTDILRLLWKKFAFICAQAGLTAGARQPIGTIREVEAAWAMFGTMVDEVLALALACGVDVTDGTRDELLDLARNLEPDATSSLYHDLSNGRPSELEQLHGSVVRLARDVGQPAPMHDAVYALLKVWDNCNVAAKAQSPS